jgi:2-polyprenyl-6-methoxyphenol hydroxylase-like FAD-dependent oxidoreductase
LIAVIGAGIGGFAAALLLSCAGFPVTLIEKRARSEEESAGLQLSRMRAGSSSRPGSDLQSS